MATMDHEASVAYARIVAQMLLADSQLTVAEMVLLRSIGKRLGLSQAEIRAMFLEQNDFGVTQHLLSLIPADQHDNLLTDLETASMSDGSMAMSEKVMLRRIRKALDRTDL